MNCPSCSASFTQEVYEGVTIEVCSKCKGVWLDQGELIRITSRKEKIFKSNEVEAVNRLCGVKGAKKEEESRGISCPKCQQTLKTFNYSYSSNIFLDQCTKGCGTWLDADELEKVQMHAELWQDKLEAHRDRFENLASQMEQDTRKNLDAMTNAPEPSRFKFIYSLVRGLVRFD